MSILIHPYEAFEAGLDMITKDQAVVKYVQMLVKKWNSEHQREASFVLLLNTSHIVSIMSVLGVSAVQAERRFELTIIRSEIQYPTLAKLY